MNLKPATTIYTDIINYLHIHYQTGDKVIL